MFCHIACDVSSLCWELGVSYVSDVSKQGKNYGGYCPTWPNVQRSDILMCTITFQYQWLLSSALDWGETCSSLQGSCMFNKDWQRHQGNKKNQMTWATPRLTEYHPLTNEQWEVCVVWRCGLTASRQCNRPRGDVPAAIGCWCHPRARLHRNAGACKKSWQSRGRLKAKD